MPSRRCRVLGHRQVATEAEPHLGHLFVTALALQQHLKSATSHTVNGPGRS